MKTLYGLRQSPRHWYNKINTILISIGLTPSLEDPCLYSGLIQDPSDHSSEKSSSPLTLGLYVDDFVYFSEDPAVEALFCHLLSKRCKVDFMGVVNGSWVFILHGVSHPTPFRFISINQVLLPIWLKASFKIPGMLLLLPHLTVLVHLLTPLPPPQMTTTIHWLNLRTAAYQSLIGSISWLSSSTRPDLSAVYSFLASYSNKPLVGHMKAALYALHYIHSTQDYGISFTSDSIAPIYSYIHFPPTATVAEWLDRRFKYLKSGVGALQNATTRVGASRRSR